VSRWIVRLDALLASLEKWLTLLALSLLIVLSGGQLIARNLEVEVPGWIDPLLHRLVLWGGLLGASLAVRSQTHIRFDLLGHRLSAARSRQVSALTAVFSAGICLMLARACMTFVLAEQEMSATTLAGVPGWVFPVIIPVSFVFMAVHFLCLPFRPPMPLAPPSFVEPVTSSLPVPPPGGPR